MVEIDMKKITGKRLSEAEIQTIKLVVEKSKVKRERASLIINKGIALFFSFIMLAVLGVTNGLITQKLLNIMVLLGFAVLIIATIPYLQLMKKSEDELDRMLNYVFE